MAYLTKPAADEIHTNRISKFEIRTKKTHREQAFVANLEEGQRVITKQFGEAILESIDRTGAQVMSILVKGTAGIRRETIYPLHIIKIQG